ETVEAIPGLVVVMECDRPSAGAFVAPIGAGLRVGRGAERELREGRIDLPDSHLSRDHFDVAREGARFRVTDRGSRNHTLVTEKPIASEVIEPGTLFRAGHTFFTCLTDVAPCLGAGERAAWPFLTTNADFARDLGKLERIAQSPLPVLLLGETGTGKEVLAQALHARSKRRGAFVPVNCGALPKDLAPSLLFGHRRGAFSGATTSELGFIRTADGGTLFLDEIGDLPPDAQSTLLRVLQEREVTPVGEFHGVPVDVRIVSATHKPLADHVRSGEFRADLFARLRGFSFTLPPLRARPFDVGELIGRIAPASMTFKPDAAYALLRHEFPLNVRELKQAIDVAAVLADGAVRSADLPETIASPESPNLDEEDSALRDELVRRLAETDRNVSQIARDMNKARQQIQRWIKRFGI
ncbi:MAG TPA: sigma 54-interacting transcriptional regulator, partial [Polyangiaceae bacterium]|nr:sigma 54-interacting transcriptional regulator [Polyangiaceae bacterium]